MGRSPQGVWFVRRKGRRCDLAPASIQGHVLTGLYLLFVTGISLFFAERLPDPPMLVAWIVLVLAATFLFAVTALRMSGPAPAAEGGRACS